jgi:hypothetical protein
MVAARDAPMVGGLRSGLRSEAPHVSWTYRRNLLDVRRPHCGASYSDRFLPRPSYWADKIAPVASNLLLLRKLVEVRGCAVRLSSQKVSRRTALLRRASTYVNNETRAPLVQNRNLRCRGARARAASRRFLAGPSLDTIEGAHEKNARECNSRGRVARRSG